VPLCTINLDSERCVASSVMSTGEGANCGKHLAAKAQAALTILRCIPTPVRRGLPVLVNAQGLLLAIPVRILSSIQFDTVLTKGGQK
jgi:hypothetical protein